MRAFDGQHSDNVAIKRSRDQKQMQLQQLKEQLATLKPHTAPAIREAMVKRITELDQELRQPPKPSKGAREGGAREGAPREGGGSRENSFRSTSSREGGRREGGSRDGASPRSPRGDGFATAFASPRRRG